MIKRVLELLKDKNNIKEFLTNRDRFLKENGIQLTNPDEIKELELIQSDLLTVGEASAISNTPSSDMQHSFDKNKGMGRRKFLTTSTSVALAGALGVILPMLGQNQAKAEEEIDPQAKDNPICVNNTDCTDAIPQGGCSDKPCVNNEASCVDYDYCNDTICSNSKDCIDMKCTDGGEKYYCTNKSLCGDGTACTDKKCTNKNDCADNYCTDGVCVNEHGCTDYPNCKDTICTNKHDCRDIEMCSVTKCTNTGDCK